MAHSKRNLKWFISEEDCDRPDKFKRYSFSLDYVKYRKELPAEFLT